MNDVLTRTQRAIADRVLGEEEELRRHVVIALSGAHAYGFPSPDSDLDLKGIHVLPTSALVGLHAPVMHVERMEVIEGVEIDYSSNEIGGALASILKGNGNYIERVLGSFPMTRAPEIDALAPLVRGVLSKRVFEHYRGFAASQRRELATRRTAKRVLYVLRTALTGVHMLRTGETVTDLTQLLDPYGFGEARALIERKLAGERTELAEHEIEHWSATLDRAFAALAEARAASILPDEPPSPSCGALEDFLVELRRRNFDESPTLARRGEARGP
ncbi:MAG: nucleotidyltransferase domain-containing protein [Polyangiales bacterium]